MFFILAACADFFADVKHGRFVALALADHDRAIHADGFHFRAHGFDRGLIGLVAVAQPHRPGRRDRRQLHDAQKFQAQLAFHKSPWICLEVEVKGPRP